MMRQVRRYCWWSSATVLLFGVAVAAWFGWRWLTPQPGSSEEVFSRIRVGMDLHEALAILRTYDDCYNDGIYSRVVTKDGRSLGCLSVGLPLFNELPPPREIEHGELEIVDDGWYGQELKVLLGPGGVVTGKSLSPGVWENRWHKIHDELFSAEVWEDRLHKLHRTLFSPEVWEGRLHKLHRTLFSPRVWEGRRHKIQRALRHRGDDIAIVLGGVLLLGSTWAARRWLAGRKRSAALSK